MTARLGYRKPPTERPIHVPLPVWDLHQQHPDVDFRSRGECSHDQRALYTGGGENPRLYCLRCFSYWHLDRDKFREFFGGDPGTVDLRASSP